jgi:peroxiredoxin
MRRFLFALVLAPLVASLPAFAQNLSGRRAPSFSLPDANQVQHDILDYRGKWLVLTWITTVNCDRCGPFTKALDPLQKQVAVLNVMLSPPETAVTATRYATEHKITSPILFDQSQVAIGYFKATPSNSRIDTPHAFIINPEGRIVDDWSVSRVGTILAAKGGVAAALQALMSGKK